MKMNERFFESINNSHKNYWLGYISQLAEFQNPIIIIKNHYHTHLLKLAKELSILEKNIQKNETHSEIRIKNQKIFNDIIVAKPCPKHIIDYWRGVIDAIGKLSEERKELIIQADHTLCQKFLCFCKKFTNTKSKVNNCQIKIHGDNAMKIAQILYTDSILYLDSNYKIFSKWEQFDNNAIFPKVVKFFHKIMPQKFSVKRCKITSALEGDCCYKNNKYFIRINNNLNDKESVNCLLHELAHIDTMLEQEEDLHGSAFGMAYSKIYKLFEAEFTS